MRLEIFIVDAFTEHFGCGNPAGVLILGEDGKELTDEVLQKIAFEACKSETAFVFQEEGGFSIRWFTPMKEMPLCGHATLAAAKVLFERNPHWESLSFGHANGRIDIGKDAEGNIAMTFPLDNYTRTPVESLYRSFFHIEDFEDCLVGEKTGKVALVVDRGFDLTSIRPDFAMMRRSGGVFSRGIGVTKASDRYDFETRYFNPWAGVDEDPVTGSVHTLLGHYWSDVLGKRRLVAYQRSQRPGILLLEIKEGSIVISGKARIAIEGFLRP